MQDTRSARLREFQDRLTERLRHATATPVAARLALVAGAHGYLVDLAEAGEIVPVPPAFAGVPMTQPWFRGLINLRGAPTAVSDLSMFAGGAAVEITKEARVLAFSPRLNLPAGLLVSRIQGLKALDALRDPADGTLAGGDDAPSAARWLGRPWVDESGRTWRELSLQQLALDERFLSIAR